MGMQDLQGCLGKGNLKKTNVWQTYYPRGSEQWAAGVEMGNVFVMPLNLWRSKGRPLLEILPSTLSYPMLTKY